MGWDYSSARVITITKIITIARMSVLLCTGYPFAKSTSTPKRPERVKEVQDVQIRVRTKEMELLVA